LTMAGEFCSLHNLHTVTHLLMIIFWIYSHKQSASNN
jgi:hypothetical protein